MRWHRSTNPNIAAIYDVSERSQQMALVLELVEGGTVPR